jgi:SAM-dependent methyltransferase
MAEIRNTEWFDRLCRSADASATRLEAWGQALPEFPPESVQVNTTSMSGEETIREAFIFYEDCVAAFAELGKPLTRECRLLDFGTGWGRIARCFLWDMPRGNLAGIDVDPELIGICHETFGPAGFSVCPAYPPTDLPDGSFDFIVGYSVFSHLSESACGMWMSEFHRLLKPGGVVALTTRGRWFFDYCRQLGGCAGDGYQRALSGMFPDMDEAKARYDRGEFVHSNAAGVSGGGPRNSDFYGETFIPEPYARRAWSDRFALARFLFEPGRQSHPIMFFLRHR